MLIGGKEGRFAMQSPPPSARDGYRRADQAKNADLSASRLATVHHSQHFTNSVLES